MQEKTKTPKFTIEQLVAIGDAIHNSDTAFIIANTEYERTDKVSKNEALICMKGNRNELMDLLYHALSKDEDMRSIVSEVMAIFALENLKNIFGEK